MLLGFGGPPRILTFDAFPEIGIGGGIAKVDDCYLFRYFMSGVMLSELVLPRAPM